MESLLGDEAAWQQMLLGVVVFLCLYLFFSLRRELLDLKAQQRNLEEDLTVRVSLLEKSSHALSRKLEDIDTRGAGAPPVPRIGMNVTKRAQALRMLRRGDQIEQIASHLEVPQSEVKLLIKVHQMALEGS